ncbi:heavy metal translocating P-type ATPase [Bullifex porci]|uniref:heavy metal translocating P-type ATPase n=1 Tax=Bullifex porci TaxID=2606638 RepID=UPI0023F55D7C|nr:heavy metal translocating P-type ATPase [Bullifex porci]MDD7255745.1 heavy metal translocating P-type ATPase [Bullifex porci]MDY2741449.1 heavy metal translocating P-type ATPase [Bullifex porci]
MRREFDVFGMSCAACSASVEKAVKSVKGCENVSVSLLTNSMSLEGSASDEDIIKAVEKAGYSAQVKGSKVEVKQAKGENVQKRLIISVILLVIHLYISMGAMVGLPVGIFSNHSLNATVQLTLSMLIMMLNRKFFISGTKALLRKSPNMDTLVSLGASAAFIYSYVAMALMFLYPEHAHKYYHELYYEAVSTILTLITVGKTLEERSKRKTTDAIDALLKLAPEKAVVERDGKEETVDVKDIKVDDIFILYPGSHVPVDGVIISGSGSFDESSITGESVPVDKSVGQNVIAGCINVESNIKARATRVGEDTTLSRIIKLVNEAASSKAPISRVADKVSSIFVPSVIVIALITFVTHLLLNAELSYALSRAVAVLVISCPCALGLATPVAIMVASGKGAKNGILFKDAAVIENTSRAGTIVFDKTGTVTTGKMKVVDEISFDDSFLNYAYTLESKSEHPLAKAVCNYAIEKNKALLNAEGFKALLGNGVEATIDGSTVYGGSVKFISSKLELESGVLAQCDKLSEEGKTPLLFIKANKLLGIIAISDTIRDDSKSAISELKNMGLRTVLLTGDNEKTANAINRIVKFDEVISGVLPDEKEAYIRSFQGDGKVIMVGDGINDSPALMRADIGMAVSGGTDAAIGSASIVLMGDTVSTAVSAIRLSRSTLKVIKENLFWAFIYNLIGIPLAAGIFTPIFGWSLNPMFASLAMSLSSFCVVTNALRINMFNLKDSRKDKKYKFSKEKKMEKTLHIEGMMCDHCEKRVKKALENVDGVAVANVSHEAGTAVVTLNKDVSNETLKKVVEDQDYSVTKID